MESNMTDNLIKEAVLKILKNKTLNKENLSFSRLTGDASDRSYFRLSALPPGSQTYVLMKMKKGFNSPAEEITRASKEIDELPFLNVQRFLRKIGGKVPEIIGFDAQLGIIILEDLGDISLFDKFPSLNCQEIKKIYSALILELINYQSTPRPKSPCIAFYRKYDREMCLWELNHFAEWGIESFLDVKLEGEEKAVIDKFFEKITDRFLKEKYFFSHRDYHSKNVMLKDGSFKIIDFQDAILAPVQYDLASLLRDSYVTLADDLIEDLLNLFMERAGEKYISNIDKEDFKKGFDFVSIQRNLKAAGRFVYIEKKKGNPNYIRHIGRTINYVRGNLAKYSDFDEVQNVLLKYFTMMDDKISKEYRGR